MGSGHGARGAGKSRKATFTLGIWPEPRVPCPI